MENNVGVTYECYKSIVMENNRLKDELQKEKYAHTETKARIVYAFHILSGNRDDKVNLFKSEHENIIQDLKNKIIELENYYKF